MADERNPDQKLRDESAQAHAIRIKAEAPHQTISDYKTGWIESRNHDPERLQIAIQGLMKCFRYSADPGVCSVAFETLRNLGVKPE